MEPKAPLQRPFFKIDGEKLTFEQAVNKIFGLPVVHDKYEDEVPNENDELRTMVKELNYNFQEFMKKHGSPGYAQDMYNTAFSMMELLADTQPIRDTWSNVKGVTNLDLNKLTLKINNYSELMKKKNTKKSKRIKWLFK